MAQTVSELFHSDYPELVPACLHLFWRLALTISHMTIAYRQAHSGLCRRVYMRSVSMWLQLVFDMGKPIDFDGFGQMIALNFLKVFKKSSCKSVKNSLS